MIWKSVLVARVAAAAVPTVAYCFPSSVQNGLDTATLWTTIIAAVMAGIALIMVGVNVWWQHQHGSGQAIVAHFGRWLTGVLIVGGASGIAAIFIPSISHNCTPAPTGN